MPQERYPSSPEEPVDPISPDEVAAQQLEQMPPQVVRTFNRLIGETALNGYAVIRQDDVVRELVEAGLSREEIYRRGWLNVEEMYREKGWEVTYDKPAYNEDYPATFTFRAAKKQKD